MLLIFNVAITGIMCSEWRKERSYRTKPNVHPIRITYFRFINKELHDV